MLLDDANAVFNAVRDDAALQPASGANAVPSQPFALALQKLGIAASSGEACATCLTSAVLEVEVLLPRANYPIDSVSLHDSNGQVVLTASFDALDQVTTHTHAHTRTDTLPLTTPRLQFAFASDLGFDTPITRMTAPIEQTAPPSGAWDQITTLTITRGGELGMGDVTEQQLPSVAYTIRALRLRRKCKGAKAPTPAQPPQAA